MSLFGKILLAVGFLAGAFVSVRMSNHVEWPLYGACAGAMAVGLFLVRRASKSGEEREKALESVSTLQRCAAALCDKLGALRREVPAMDVYDVHGRLDRDLLADLDTFAENREGMIRRFDLTTYAEVMSAFALAERYVNRCWSASADGYVDEVQRCLELAEGEMLTARDKLAQAAGRT